MSSVRNIANHNRTVVCTIHAPSENVFRLFDSLILLAMGRQTYFGPAYTAVDYFSQADIGWRIKPGQNPADFLMEASQGLPINANGQQFTVRELSNFFLHSPIYAEIEGNIETVVQAKAEGDLERKHSGRRFRSNSLAQVFAREEQPRSLLSQIAILGYRQFIKTSKMVCGPLEWRTPLCL